MGTRRARALALLLSGLSASMLAFAFASVVLPGSEALPDRPGPLTVIIAASVMLSYPLVGTVIVIRRPGNVIGWLFIALGLGFTVSFFSTEYVGRTLIGGWPLPAPGIIAWAGGWSFVLSTGLAFVWIPLLFPTGHLPGRRWRWVARAAAVAMALGTVAAALQVGPVDAAYPQLVNPLGVPALAPAVDAINAMYFPLIAALGLASIASLVLRFRHAHAIERQQVKWLLLATGSFLATLIVAFATQVDALFLVALVAAAGIPVSAGFAILRYRLWDIDRVVSRTIAWTLVTAVLALVFAGVVVGLQALLARVTSGQTLAVAASTLVAFALFQPVRRRVQRAVDRRFNRSRYDAERTVEAFGGGLRSDLDLAAIRDDLVGALDRTVQPATSAVWLRQSVTMSERR